MRDNKGVPFTDLKKKRREKNLNIIDYQVFARNVTYKNLPIRKLDKHKGASHLSASTFILAFPEKKMQYIHSTNCNKSLRAKTCPLAVSEGEQPPVKQGAV